MTPDALYEWLHRQPFRPFRIHMSNGRIHEVRHPEAAILTSEEVAVGVHDPGEKFARSIGLLALININELEPSVSAN